MKDIIVKTNSKADIDVAGKTECKVVNMKDHKRKALISWVLKNSKPF